MRFQYFEALLWLADAFSVVFLLAESAVYPESIWNPAWELNWTQNKLNYCYQIDTWVFQLLMIKAFVALSIELIWLIYCSIQKYSEKELIHRLMSLLSIIVFIQIRNGFISNIRGFSHVTHMIWAIYLLKADSGWISKPYKIPEEENDILHAAKNTDENLYIHLLPYTNRSSVGKFPF